MSREEVLAAVRNLAPSQDFVWDGVDEDDRPATEEALRAGNDAYRRQRGGCKPILRFEFMEHG